MIKTLQERKQEIVEYCQKEYLNKNAQWWKSKYTKYKTTKELVPDVDNYIQTSDSFFVKKDYHLQLLTTAFVFILGCIVLKIIFDEASMAIFVISNFIFLVIIIYTIFNLKDKSIKIVLTKDCFWFYKMKIHIPWKFLAASLIKEEHRGEDIYTYFVLHYYDEIQDGFIQFEYRYMGLEMDLEDICFHIEKFKGKSSKSSPQISTT